jgi:hypothetical protein
MNFNAKSKRKINISRRRKNYYNNNANRFERVKKEKDVTQFMKNDGIYYINFTR